MRARSSRSARLRGVVSALVAVALVPASFPLTGLLTGRGIPSAFAQKPTPSKADIAKAKTAFFEGLDLEKENKWDEALKRFQLVAKVRMTPQVRFHIALCEEHVGQLIEALHDFELAEADAKAEKVEAVIKEAPEHAAAIKPRIPKLTIKVPSDVDGLAVTLDGNPIDPKGSEETLVNPGSHKIEATADKRKPFSQEVTLGDGESKTINVKVPLLEEPKEEPPPKKEEPPPPPPPGPPVAAFVVGGIGVLALLGAGGFYLARSSVKSDLDSVCGDDRQSCPPDRQGAIDNGKTYTTLTNVFAIVGLVGVGAGIVLYVTAPKNESKPTTTTSMTTFKPSESKGASIRLVPNAPGANVGGLSIAGVF